MTKKRRKFPPGASESLHPDFSPKSGLADYSSAGGASEPSAESDASLSKLTTGAMA